MTLRNRLLALATLAALAAAPLALAEPTTTTAKAPATTKVAAPKESADKPSPRGGIVKPDAKWMARHETYVELAKKGGIDVYFEGDSITDGWHGSGKAVWEKEFAPLKAANFGIGGDRTQHVLWRLQNGELDGVNPKAVVLMIGTNNAGSNSPAEVAAGVKAIVDTIHEKAPSAKILLLAIFPRGAAPEDKLRKLNDAANAILAKFDDGKTVKYLNINDKFLDQDGTLSKDIMGDLLHPNGKGYQIWADAIREPLKELLK